MVIQQTKDLVTQADWDNAIDLGDDDTLFVYEGVTVASEGYNARAISAIADDTVIRILGNITTATTEAIYVVGDNNYVFVAESGFVSATSLRQDSILAAAAIAVSGQNNLVINNGTLESNGYYGFACYEGTLNATLINRGQIIDGFRLA